MKKDIHLLKIRILMNTISRISVICYARWLKDNKPHDFTRYEEIVKNKISTVLPSITYICGTRRTFGFIFKFNNIFYQFTVRKRKELMFCECFQIEEVKTK